MHNYDPTTFMVNTVIQHNEMEQQIWAGRSIGLLDLICRLL